MYDFNLKNSNDNEIGKSLTISMRSIDISQFKDMKIIDEFNIKPIQLIYYIIIE